MSPRGYGGVIVGHINGPLQKLETLVLCVLITKIGICSVHTAAGCEKLNCSFAVLEISGLSLRRIQIIFLIPSGNSLLADFQDNQ